MILTLKIANQSFWLTPLLIMMHHNTKFGNKMFGGWGDIIWTNTAILTLHCDLDPKCSNPFFHKTLWLMMIYHQTKFGCQGIYSSEDIVDRLILWSYQPLLWPWPWWQKTFFFHMTLWLMMLYHHTKVDNKMFYASEHIIRTNICQHTEPLL